MMHARDEFRSRWSTGYRLIATTLLSLLPFDGLLAQSAPARVRQAPSEAASKLPSTGAAVTTTSTDTTAPELTWVAPSNGGVIKTATPRLVIRYADPAGAAGSPVTGVDPASLRVSIDDVDRTDLFTTGAAEASAVMPAEAALTAGLHTYEASISDLAGNRTEVAGQFRVDLTPLDFFGPRKYVRTTGPKDVYTSTLNVPPWLKAPFTLRVQNGEADGMYRVSSATVEINGSAVLTESDFNQNAAAYERSVALAPTAELTVTLASKPASYLTIWLSGTSADATVPGVTWVAPPNGSAVNTPRPHLAVRYSDPAGAGEPAASGVDLNSLRVAIDDVDRTTLFTRRSDEASADIPVDAPLAEGQHVFRASIADRAGNRSEISGGFRVDLTSPVIQFTAPAAGSHLATLTPVVTFRYQDEVAIELASIDVQVNGQPLPSSSITASTTEASIAAGPLPEGPNQIVATIRDSGGNAATASLSFNVDVTAPQLTIAKPLDGARIGSASVPLTLTYWDGQGIALATVVASVDGTPIPLTTAAGHATGEMTGLEDGEHSVTATVADLAGNTTTVTATFSVDVTVPVIAVTDPAAGANINTAIPTIAIGYSDEQGVATDTLQVRINEVDQTALFTKSADGATAALNAALPEGTTAIAAQISDVTGNVGATSSTFVVDTIPPTGAIEQPPDRVNSSAPLVFVRYGDSGSGIDPSTVALTIDGAPAAGVLGAGATSASGTPQPLSDGTHEISVGFADRAGNPATVSKSFVVDTRTPEIAIAAPLNDSFIGTTTPALIVTYRDPGGTGVDVSSVRLLLKKGDAPETDITSYVTITSGDARGVVPAGSPLGDGTYRLRVVIRDLAGNVSIAESAFEVDTVAPSYVIESPAANGYVNSATPQFTLRWSDGLSGVDVTRAAVFIDGIDRTARFTFTSDGATGMLQASESLADGPHSVELVLFDRAGNQAPRVPHAFTVDTVDPVASIDAPSDTGYIGAAPHVFGVTYGDGGGSGVDPASVTIAIDGTDRTAEFAVTATGATATIASPLPDGLHSVSVTVVDWAANSVTATSSFTVDSVVPVVAITAPEAGAWSNEPAVTVNGTVVDLSPLTIEVNGLPFVVTGGAFSASVPTHEGPFVIRAVAHDAAGNEGAAEVTINVDTQPPAITISEPADGSVTSHASVRIAGRVDDTSAVTLTLDGNPLAIEGANFAADVPLSADGARQITLVATDAAANASSRQITVTRDTVAPGVTVASPTQSSVVGSLPLVIRGTITDATAVTVTVDGVAATVTDSSWEASVGGVADGVHSFVIVASDAAGNSTSLSHQVTIDTAAPVVSIAAPASGSLTNAATTSISGTAIDGTLVSVTAAGIAATLQPGSAADEKSFTISGVALSEGDNTLTVVATDALSRTGEASVLVTRDSTPPMVVLDAPALITRTSPATVTASIEENLAIRDVVFTLDSDEIATLTAPPFTATVFVPATAAPGDILTLAVVATDTAGNATTVTRSLRVASGGAIIGQVLSDATGLPLRFARVRSAAGDQEAVTDERGRYALPANDQNVVLIVEAAAGAQPMTSVERNVAIESGVGTVPVDARLTPLENATNISSAGGTVSTTNIVVTVPGGAVSTTTPMRLTRLSPQGLPNLLPLGWSPVAAFELRVEGDAAEVPFDVRMHEVPAGAPALVHYAPTMRAWRVVQTNLVPAAGVVTATLPRPGSYALVVADDTNVPSAVAGEILGGIDMQPIGDAATSSGSVVPPTLPPSGGSATGTLIVHSSTPIPSGTVVQADVTETYTLTTGEQAAEDSRTQDIVLYRTGGSDVRASFPIVPSRTFASEQLTEGKVHLDILAGRETVRGRTGGSQALTLTSGEVTITIPAGSLPQDLAINATAVILSSFLPSTAAAAPIAEVVLDFGGATLATSAELSIGIAAVPPGESVIVARVERVGGIPKVVVVAATRVEDGRFVSTEMTGFAGIRVDGRYIFYRLNGDWGIITGSVGFPFAAGTAVITTDGLPFVALSDSQQRYSAIALGGTRTISAVVPATSLSGQTSVSVVAGGSVGASFGLTAATTTAAVTPADGSIRVPTSAQVEIAATAPLQASSANSGTIRLERTDGATVQVRYVFSGSGRILAVVPQTALEPGQTYRLLVNGLLDVYGGAVAVGAVSFTTKPDEPPQYDTNRIVFSMPDAGGMVTVSAPAGSLPPGTRIIVVNSGNGVVVSFTVGNDGSFTGQLPATIDDRLLVTVTDPQGNVVNFERSTFVFNDGSGRVAIGTGGGTVEGAGGVELRIPDGALESGAVFKVEAFGPDAYPERPDLPGANFGGGLRITSEQMPTLKREGDLVFPRPADAPAGSFFYVYRRMEGPDGQVTFETLDHAFDDGNGKVVTASFPFIGWNDSAASWHAAADLGGIGFGLGSSVAMFMMWTWDASLPGLPLPGAIIGKVYRPVWKPGATEPDYEPVPGAMIRAVSGSPDITNIARSQADGQFTLWDPAYRGGPVEVEARGPLADDYVRGTAFQANVANTRSTAFGALATLYGYAAEINFTFPASSQPKVSDVRTHVMKLDAQGKRQDAGGIVIAGTPLIIGFRFAEQTNQPFLQNASVLGQEIPVRTDTSADPLKMDFILAENYTPAQPGTYTIKATAIPPLGGSPVVISHTFLAIAQGGSNAQTLNGVEPDIVTDLVDPRPGSIGNATNVFSQIVFTEPVRRIPGNVRLIENGGGDVPLTISGIGVDAGGNQYLIPDLAAQGPETGVTSITIQPRTELKFGKTYTIRLDGGIIDFDKNAQDVEEPRSLKDAPRTFEFTTLKPEILGGTTQAFSSVAVTALGDRVYTVENSSPHGKLRVFDIGTDPATPRQVGETYLSGIPTHVAGEEQSPVTGGRVVVAPATLMLLRGPSNLWIYDASTDAPERIGAVSLTESTEQGIALRVAVKGRYAYAWTWPVGLQVIDLVRAQQLFAKWNGDPSLRTRMYTDLVTSGRGFGSEAIVNTIAVPGPAGGSAHMFGLKVGDFVLDGVSQPLMVASGSLPLVIANPQTMQSWRFQQLTGPDGISLTWGWSVALARIGDRPIAVITGRGTARDGGEWVLATVDLTNPRSPKLLGTIKFAAQPLDVVVKDSLALVAAGDRIVGINLGDPANPTHAGEIPNIAGRLALAEGGILISTASGGSSAGLRTAALGSYALILSMSDVTLNRNGRTEQPMTIEYQIVSPPANLHVARIFLRQGQDSIATVQLPHVTPGRHTITIPAGLQFNPSGQMVRMTVRGQGGRPAAVQRIPRSILTRQTQCSRPLVNPRPPARSHSQSIDRMTAQPDSDIAATSLAGRLISPSTVARGAAFATITLAPEFIGSQSQVYLRSVDGDWRHTNVSTFGGLPSFTLPSELTATAGLILVSTTAGIDESNEPLPLLIVDTSLPELDTSLDFWALVAQVLRDESGTPVNIRLLGHSFVPGMKVVLGSEDTAAFEMETTYVDSNTLEAAVPTPTLGRSEDLFVAALAVDRVTMSNAVRLEPLGIPIGASGVEDEIEKDPLAGFHPDDVELTATEPIAPGLLIVRGVGLVEGGEVQFAVTDRDGTVRTATSRIEGVVAVGGPQVASRNVATDADETVVVEMQGTVVVNLPPENVPTANIRGESGTGTAVVTSAQQRVPVQDEVLIPLGASYPFGVYKRKNSTGTNRYIFLQCDVDTTTYELVSGAGTSIQVHQAAYPQIRREVERDVTDVVYIRGVGLSTSLDDTPAERALSELVLSGDATVTRKVRVQEASLRGDRRVRSYPADTDIRCLAEGSTTHYSVDCLINKYADKHRVLPQVVKAQVAQETQFDKNFRHEPSTIDLLNLSGDGAATMAGSSRRINLEPFSLYRIGGTYVAAGFAPVEERFGHGDALRLTRTPKRLDGYVTSIGNVPSHVERRPAVVARIVRPGATRPTPLTAVHCDRIFRRVHSPAIDEPPPVLPQNTFCVDYDTATLRLSTALGADDRLVVGYVPLYAGTQQSPGSIIAIGRGERIAAPLATPEGVLTTQEILANRELVRTWPVATNYVVFREGDSMAQHFQRNVGNDTTDLPEPTLVSRFSRAGFLSGTTADKNHEFRVSAANLPTRARDPKLRSATAQFWGAASYGPMQVTLPLWRRGDLRQDFEAIFPLTGVGARNLIELLWEYPKALELGVAFDKILYRNRNVTDPNSVTEGEAWWEVLRRYNGSSAYASTVLDLSNTFAPR